MTCNWTFLCRYVILIWVSSVTISDTSVMPRSPPFTCQHCSICWSNRSTGLRIVVISVLRWDKNANGRSGYRNRTNTTDPHHLCYGSYSRKASAGRATYPGIPCPTSHATLHSGAEVSNSSKPSNVYITLWLSRLAAVLLPDTNQRTRQGVSGEGM